jgi:hypothetical protein
MRYMSSRTPGSLILALALAAIMQTTSAAVERGADTGDLGAYRGLIVDTVVIDNREIYDTSDPEFSSFVFAWANRLHWKTAAHVVRREVLIEKEQPFDPDLAEETARNLRERLVLYDAWIEVERTQQDSVLVRVVTIDEWSLAAVLNLTQIDEGTRWTAGLRERNLFGRDLLLDLSYHNDPEEGTWVSSAYADDRFYGRPLRLDVSYDDNPVAKTRSLTAGHPFYSMAQKLWYKLQLRTTDGRRDIYDDRRRIGASDYTSDHTEAAIAWRTGSYYKKLTFALDYLYSYSQVENDRVLGTQPGDSLTVASALPEDTIYHKVEAGIEYRQMDFIKLRRIDGFGYTEDFTLGPAAMLAAGRALNDGGVMFDVFTLGAEHTDYFSSTLVDVAAHVQFWRSGGETSRSLISVGARAYNRSLSYLTWALAAGFTRDYRPEEVNSLILGSRHLRGYPDQFRTGDRRLTVNTEARFFTGLTVFTVEIGGAVFGDLGRVWRDNDDRPSRYYGSAGIGLRLSSKNASRAALARIDLSYSETQGWSLSVGSGQFFEAAVAFTRLTTY